MYIYTYNCVYIYIHKDTNHFMIINICLSHSDLHGLEIFSSQALLQWLQSGEGTWEIQRKYAEIFYGCLAWEAAKAPTCSNCPEKNNIYIYDIYSIYIISIESLFELQPYSYTTRLLTS